MPILLCWPKMRSTGIGDKSRIACDVVTLSGSALVPCTENGLWSMQSVQILAVRLAAAAASALAEALPDLERRQVSAAAPNQATGGLCSPADQAPNLPTPDRQPSQTLGENGHRAELQHGGALEVRMAIWQPDAVTPGKVPPTAHGEHSRMGMATPPAQACFREHFSLTQKARRPITSPLALIYSKSAHIGIEAAESLQSMACVDYVKHRYNLCSRLKALAAFVRRTVSACRWVGWKGTP